jgi:tetratricopeptide (TPR) repeat protein
MSAHAGRPVVQDFRPLRDSIEWELGQRYWRERGAKAFISDAQPVPYVVNNDGSLSENAAQALFESLTVADRNGNLESDIYVLELGIGVGLFARLFLDSFRALCEEREANYYDRLHYVLGDYSTQMLADACRHGILSEHAGRYVLRQVDATCPERSLRGDPIFTEPSGRPFRAVFLNYLLDCLPATVLRVQEEHVQELCVRTCLARNIKLEEHTQISVEEMAELAGSTDESRRKELLPLFGLFASDYEYRPARVAEIPYADFAVPFASKAGLRSVLHNFGAIQCLERLLDMLVDQGFILLNDYGNVEAAGADDFQHQRFSQSTSVGINFPMLAAYFRDGKNARWIEPEEEDASIHARLLAREIAEETIERFRDRFSKSAADWRAEPAARARDCCKRGQFETALSSYQLALERQPRNWALMAEVAQFLTAQCNNPRAGLEMAKAGLALNSSCSAGLWNALGDALYFLGRLEDSERAYERALLVNSADVRARYNLAFIYHQTNHAGRALRIIAEALELDQEGAYRQALLQTQAEVLDQLTKRHQKELLRMVDRVTPPLEALALAKGTGESRPKTASLREPAPAATMMTP